MGIVEGLKTGHKNPIKNDFPVLATKLKREQEEKIYKNKKTPCQTAQKMGIDDGIKIKRENPITNDFAFLCKKIL